MSALRCGGRALTRRWPISLARTLSLVTTSRNTPIARSTRSYEKQSATAPPGNSWGRRPGRSRLLAGGGLALAATTVVGLTFLHKDLLTAECAEQEKASHEERCEVPSYSRAEISAHNNVESGVWVTYKHKVYDVTEFLPQHPGGVDKLLLAAGGAVDAYWQVFAQHNSEQVQEILDKYYIGDIVEADRHSISQTSKEGPYAKDPVRSPILKVNTNEPFNAETPSVLLTEHFTTPNDIFFVRNHLPVPEVDAKVYRLEVSGPGLQGVSLTLEDLKKKFPQHTVTATIQCAGHRREEMVRVKEVRGIPWTSGAIGNATWTGTRLRDVLVHAGLKQDEEGEEGQVKHIHLEGLDQNPLTGESYGASIPIEKALSPSGDCLLVHTMNGETLPRDHGYPVRALVPGTVGARNVKWLNKIVASQQEYGGQWQQRDYKGFSPSVDWSNVDFTKSPAIQELPVTSIICSPQEGGVVSVEDQEVVVQGIAWSGGGREIVRVDVSADEGKSWLEAELTQGTGQRRGRAWAWTLWTATVPLTAVASGSLKLCCKAVDSAYNVQPDTTAAIWNLRGCLSNAWHRIHIQLK